MQAEFANDGLFPKRGKELNYVVNGKPRITRGALGESATITVNGKEADIYTEVHANDNIKVIESTAGEAAKMDINQLPEYGATMCVEVNEKKVELPEFALVNGQLQSGYYSIQENDNIEFINYYTVRQIAEFMDVIIKEDMNIYVNNKLATMDTKVYENFSVIWTMEELQLSDRAIYDDGIPDTFEDLQEDLSEELQEALPEDDGMIPLSIQVTVNGNPIRLEGKGEYVFVDVFQYIDFDLSSPQGTGIVTDLNGRPAQYMEPIRSGDVIQIYWKD